LKNKTCPQRKYKLLDLTTITKLKDKNVAHAIGAIAADGTISKRSDRRNCDRLTFRVKKDDENWVTCIRDALGIDNEILPTVYPKNEYRKTETTCVGFQINQAGLRKPFSKWSIIPKKYNIMPFPHHLPQRLKRHFIRGFFEGDGCVFFKHYPGRGYKQEVKITGCCLDFLMGLQKELDKKNITAIIRTDGVRKGKPCYNLVLRAASYIAFYEYMYGDGGNYMKRKKDKYTELVEHRKNKDCGA